MEGTGQNIFDLKKRFLDPGWIIQVFQTCGFFFFLHLSRIIRPDFNYVITGEIISKQLKSLLPGNGVDCLIVTYFVCELEACLGALKFALIYEELNISKEGENITSVLDKYLPIGKEGCRMY